MVAKEDLKDIPVHLFTSDYQITGFIKLPPTKGFLPWKKKYSKRISDLLFAASERMVQKGEVNFIIINNAEIMDVKTHQVLRTAVPFLAVNKQEIQMIIPIHSTNY